MFEGLKDIIKETACTAVIAAEEALGSGEGKKKKAMAIQFVLSKLPILYPFNLIISTVLSAFIDNAIEQAVDYMKSVQYEQER